MEGAKFWVAQGTVIAAYISIMTDFYSTPAPRSPNAMRHHRRKQVGRMAVLCGVVGWIGLLVSLGLVLVSRLYRNTVQWRFMIMAGIYSGAGLVLLAAHHLLRMWERRMQTARHLPAGQEPFDAPRRKRGSALIVVLGVVAIVSLLVAHAQVRTAMTRRQRERDLLRARLQAAATEAVWFALQRLAADDDPLCDHTNESWCLRTDWKDPAGVSVRLVVTDENRFFDVNNLAAEFESTSRTAEDVCLDLMTLCGDFSPEDRVSALRDWMDADSDGAWEAPYYAQENRAGPPNRIILTWREWTEVPGFDRDYFLPHERTMVGEPFKTDPLQVFTVLPWSRRRPVRVNVNTASATVLTGLFGLDHEETVWMLVNMRNKRPIRTLEELMWAAPDVVRRVREYVDTRSRFFRIHAQAYAEGRVEAVFALAERGDQGQIEIRHWVTM